MMQVTLISLYGDKSSDFVKFITDCQAAVESALGNAFKPYDVRQVHATIVGLERRIGSSMHNLNFWKHRGRQVEMGFGDFLSFLRDCSQVPLEVQIGGFENRNYPFCSDPFEKNENSTRPYDRSFSIQTDKAVIMGWPLRGKPLTTPPTTTEEWVQEGRIYPPTLDEIRHAAQKFGILHGYHRSKTAVDNDLFFRIGLVDPKAVPSSLVPQIRQTLSGLPPLIVEITLDDLYIAAYDDDRLPLKTTQVWSVADRRVTGQFVAGLFN